jgi:cytochrome c biogenesis protein CcmG, thiol:disulfide interchange protein DsbE
MLSIVGVCRRSQVARVVAVAIAILGFGICSTASAADPVLDLESHRGRVVIVDFWASWCKPCRQSIPWLNAMRERYAAAGLDVIGVNVDAERAQAERFMRDVPIGFETVFDPDGVLARRFKVQGMPSSFVFGRNGELLETHLGFRDAKKSQRETALRELLDRPLK